MKFLGNLYGSGRRGGGAVPSPFRSPVPRAVGSDDGGATEARRSWGLFASILEDDLNRLDLVMAGTWGAWLATGGRDTVRSFSFWKQVLIWFITGKSGVERTSCIDTLQAHSMSLFLRAIYVQVELRYNQHEVYIALNNLDHLKNKRSVSRIPTIYSLWQE